MRLERCTPDVGYWLRCIFVEIKIVFLRKVTNHIRSRLTLFLGRTFYRLRLIRTLNGREFIICSGKVVSVYL